MNFAALPGFLGRATITAIVVVLASVIAEVAGPVLGGLAASLPVSGGPTYIFLALTHDASFVSASALSSFAANAATIAFLAAYARLAPGRSRLAALIPPIISWLILAMLIRGIQWTAVTAAILNAGVLVGGILVTRQTLKMDRAVQPRARATRGDLAGRALTVAVFVASLLWLSAALGPSATGVIASFPIVFIMLIFLLHRRLGDAACAILAATALQAMGGFGLMFLVAHLTVVPLGPLVGLSLALLTTVAWSAALAYLHLRLG
jgi:hypothetical protein